MSDHPIIALAGAGGERAGRPSAIGVERADAVPPDSSGGCISSPRWACRFCAGRVRSPHLDAAAPRSLDDYITSSRNQWTARAASPRTTFVDRCVAARHALTKEVRVAVRRRKIARADRLAVVIAVNRIGMSGKDTAAEIVRKWYAQTQAAAPKIEAAANAAGDRADAMASGRSRRRRSGERRPALDDCGSNASTIVEGNAGTGPIDGSIRSSRATSSSVARRTRGSS